MLPARFSIELDLFGAWHDGHSLAEVEPKESIDMPDLTLFRPNGWLHTHDLTGGQVAHQDGVALTARGWPTVPCCSPVSLLQIQQLQLMLFPATWFAHPIGSW